MLGEAPLLAGERGQSQELALLGEGKEREERGEQIQLHIRSPQGRENQSQLLHINELTLLVNMFHVLTGAIQFLGNTEKVQE